MIDFATPILGSAHPALVQARTQLLAGQFFESLISVRQALRSVAQASTK
jgi:hypothetical protein